jgi:hypothetical protein
MTTRYVRGEPGRSETFSAAVASVAVAATVGAVTFYLARLLLSRQDVSGPGDTVSVARPTNERGVLDAPRS